MVKACNSSNNHERQLHSRLGYEGPDGPHVVDDVMATWPLRCCEIPKISSNGTSFYRKSDGHVLTSSKSMLSEQDITLMRIGVSGNQAREPRGSCGKTDVGT